MPNDYNPLFETELLFNDIGKKVFVTDEKRGYLEYINIDASEQISLSVIDNTTQQYIIDNVELSEGNYFFPIRMQALASDLQRINYSYCKFLILTNITFEITIHKKETKLKVQVCQTQ